MEFVLKLLLSATVMFLSSYGHTEAAPKPLDLVTPPFSEYDFSWLNGVNRQPPSLLTMGPVTWQIYVDSFYAYQFSHPVDHTIFPSTVAARHNELAINLASLGVELTGLDGPVGRIYFQAGINTETDAGQDASTGRGYYLNQRSQLPIQQAAAGWHFHELDGINLEFGLFPSYVAMESYLPQENWNYTRPFISEFSPYYFSGSRTQIFLTPRQKLELWLVNGWQTYGKSNNGFGGGYLWNWRPTGELSLTHSIYDGSDDPHDAKSDRFYTDNYLQWRYLNHGNGWVKGSSICLVLDYGYETKGAPGSSGPMYGASLTNRFELSPRWATTLRADYFYDKTQAINLKLPSNESLPDTGTFHGTGATVTVDFIPNPWLIYRLEYMHREASVPYFSGPGGITGPNGYPVSATNPGPFKPDLTRYDDRLIANVTLRL